MRRRSTIYKAMWEEEEEKQPWKKREQRYLSLPNL